MSGRVGAGLLLLLGFALFISVRQLQDVAERAPTSRMPETLRDWNEHRLAALRPLLPPHGVVGFVAGDHADGATIQRYYLTQYVLAPVVVVRDSDRDLVIGTFDPETAPPPPPSPRHEVLLEDREQGVIYWKAK